MMASIENNPMRGDELAMHQSPRCLAETRDGTPCQGPAVRGQDRCRMHGGTEGSGAPEGNRNAVKHGRYTQQTLEEQELLEELWEILG